MAAVAMVVGGILLAAVGAGWVLLTYVAIWKPDVFLDALEETSEEGARVLGEDLPSQPLWYRACVWPARTIFLLTARVLFWGVIRLLSGAKKKPR